MTPNLRLYLVQKLKNAAEMNKILELYERTEFLETGPTGIRPKSSINNELPTIKRQC